MEDTYILGIESSCDDTSAAVMKNGILLSNVTASQAVHEAYGGSNKRGTITGNVTIDVGTGGACTLEVGKVVGAGKNADVARSSWAFPLPRGWPPRSRFRLST